MAQEWQHTVIGNSFIFPLVLGPFETFQSTAVAGFGAVD